MKNELKPSNEYSKDELYRMCKVLYSDGNNQYRIIKAMRWIVAALLTIIVIILVN